MPSLKLMQTGQTMILGNADGPNRVNNGRGRNLILVALTIGMIVLGAVAVYQQSQLAVLSKTISLQSSELAHPSTDIAILNFTVTKANSTAEPVMFLVVWNNGSIPASSGSLLIGISGQSNTFQSCYNGSENPFPIYSNDSAMLLSRLSCGDLGNKVVLSAQVDFLTNHGSVTKVFNAQTTISQSRFSKPSTVVVHHLGIRTFVEAWVAGGQTIYTWDLTVTNESPSSIVSVNGTLGSRGNAVAEASGCVVISGNNFYHVTRTTPLTQNTSCQDDSQTNSGTGPFSLGQVLDVVVAVTYSNGTSSIATTAAVVLPPYALLG